MRFLTLILCAIVAFSSAASAQRSDSIAAVVNGDIITFTDVYDRIDMVIKSSGMPNKKEFKKKLLPQVLTGLITETIQIQEAKTLGLKTSKEEIETGFEKIAGQNKFTSEQFKKILRRQNVRVATIEQQILAQLAWGKVIQREIRPRVVLGDDDINNEIDRLKTKEGQTEYSLAEIVLPIDPKSGESKTRDVASDLKKQLSKDIQKFPAAARQFSQSSSAANGGIIGWITLDQMAPEIAGAIKNLQPRMISDPIKTDDGYVLLFIREQRVIDLGTAKKSAQKFRIKTVTFDLPKSETARKQTISEATVFARDVTGCLDIVKRATNAKNASLSEVNDTQENIPSDLFNSVKDKGIGEAAKPIVQGAHVIIPMLCGREGGGASTTALEMDIENRMGMQRMDILQKRYLRDLISDAYIERRI